MSVERLQTWISEVSGPDWFWFAKFLSANDTLANAAHQAGPYIPRQVIFELFPGISASVERNPRLSFPVVIDSHEVTADATAIWYNNRVFGSGTRNEARITNWGGRSSPLLDPESTGSLCVMAFRRPADRDADFCRVWLCSDVEEEDAFLNVIGPVEPGQPQFLRGTSLAVVPAREPVRDVPCRLRSDQIPPEWLYRFPEAAEVVDRSISHMVSSRGQSIDDRLLSRRECEFEIFRSVEEAVVLPRIREGFATVDLFASFANSVLNRRKARSGASLELQVKRILEEEALPHSYDEISEDRKRPDFLFPSSAAYQDASRPDGKLEMLAVKTTCKDRWRQVLDEARRIPDKCLLTLQEGVSVHQFAQMRAARITLVVPTALKAKYPKEIRPHLLSLSEFIERTRAKCV